MKTTDRSGLGTITFQEPTTETLKSRADPGREFTFKLEKGVWRPSSALPAAWPAFFEQTSPSRWRSGPPARVSGISCPTAASNWQQPLDLTADLR